TAFYFPSLEATLTRCCSTNSSPLSFWPSSMLLQRSQRPGHKAPSTLRIGRAR
ncbi:hypothetical protein AX17_005951, partial [Amanita inopinata Kibby_2008]